MRLVFFGTSAFAVPHLERLAACGHQILRCVTQPDQPQGRGLRPQPSPVKQAALRLQMAVDEPRDWPAAAAAYQALRPELGVVISYGRLIPRALLALPAHGMLGVHPSLLPRYRGASPIVWPLLNGDAMTGVTVFRLTERMDAGDVLLQRPEPIAPRDTSDSLSARLASIGAELLAEGVAAIEQGTAAFRPQDEGAATCTTKLTKAHGRLRWTDDASVLDRQIRALNPWPGTVASWQGEPLKILVADLGPAAPSAAPGTVLAADADGIRVAAGRGSIVIHELQRSGGRRLTAREFLAGHPLRAGERLDA